MESDPGPLLIQLVIALLLVLLNGFFIATEFALMNVRERRLDSLASEGLVKAKVAIKITKRLEAYISTCRMGITMSSIGLGWLAGPAIVNFIQPLFANINMHDQLITILGYAIGFAFIVICHYIMSQQIPKIIAVQKPEQVTLWSAIPITLFHSIMRPIVWVMNRASHFVLRRAGLKPSVEHEMAHTEEEIIALVQESHDSGNIDKTELLLVDKVFQFTETVGREIMIPRTELSCLYANKSFADNLKITSQEMRTRYPVCDPDKDNIIGFVHIKDLLKASTAKRENIRSIIRPLMSVPETMPISIILNKMQKKRTEIALLFDEYGGTSGIVTMEDILEELVGEIYDEFDHDKPTIMKKDLHTHSVDGLLNIDEFNEYFGLDIVTDDYDTIGGWMYSQLDALPRKNQRVTYQHYEFTVDEVDHNRVSRIIVKEIVGRQETLSVVY